MMLGQKLKELRVRKGLTQAQLASEMEISPSAIGMYEQDRREPDAELTMRFAKFFGVTVDCLLGYKPEEQSEVLDAMRKLLYSQEGLMFNGEVLSDADIEQIFAAVEMGTALAMSRKAQADSGKRE